MAYAATIQEPITLENLYAKMWRGELTRTELATLSVFYKKEVTGGDVAMASQYMKGRFFFNAIDRLIGAGFLVVKWEDGCNIGEYELSDKARELVKWIYTKKK